MTSLAAILDIHKSRLVAILFTFYIVKTTGLFAFFDQKIYNIEQNTAFLSYLQPEIS